MSAVPKPTLLKQISQLAFLKEAWKLLNTSNKLSSGLSRSTVQEFDDNRLSNLKFVSNALASGSYKFSSVKGVALKKKNKGHRPLMISEIPDRVVHKALALKLEKILTKAYKLRNVCSFAYQKDLSIQDAIIQMASYYNDGYKFILEADIQNFFPSVDSNMLLESIYQKLPDSSIDALLKGALNQEIGNVEELKQKDIKVYEEIFSNIISGIPTGNALSPLFANVFLADFDQRMIKEGIKMIRYADDFIIMCKSKDEAKAAYEIAYEELTTKRKLRLYPLKETAAEGEKISRILNPKETIFTFLSVRFDGDRCYIPESKIANLLSKLYDLASPAAFKTNFPDLEFSLLQVLSKIKNSLDGWIAAYSFLEIENELREVDRHVDIVLYQVFKEFGFILKTKELVKISPKYTLQFNKDEKPVLKRTSNEKSGLKPSQRKNAGIPFCLSTYKNSTAGMMSFAERVIAVSNGLAKPKKRKANHPNHYKDPIF